MDGTWTGHGPVADRQIRILHTGPNTPPSLSWMVTQAIHGMLYPTVRSGRPQQSPKGKCRSRPAGRHFAIQLLLTRVGFSFLKKRPLQAPGPAKSKEENYPDFVP